MRQWDKALGVVKGSVGRRVWLCFQVAVAKTVVG